MMEKYIKIKGARTHNLKNIDLELPKITLLLLQVYLDLENPPWPLIQSLLKVKEDM